MYFHSICEVYIFLEIDCPELIALQAEILEKFPSCGTTERNVDFRPHVTIGQLKNRDARALVKNTKFEKCSMRCSHLSFIQKSNRGIYKEAMRWPFNDSNVDET